jgi:hypothetical protein
MIDTWVALGQATISANRQFGSTIIYSSYLFNNIDLTLEYDMFSVYNSFISSKISFDYYLIFLISKMKLTFSERFKNFSIISVSHSSLITTSNSWISVFLN